MRGSRARPVPVSGSKTRRGRTKITRARRMRILHRVMVTLVVSDGGEKRMNARRTTAQWIAGIGASAFLAATALAQQDFPNRPIRYITPFAAGGSQTVLARLVGQRLTEAWGQQVVVDNRPGANTIIGTELAVKSRPDGYTLVSLGNALAANHTLFKTPY